jgi:hypothetical protein
MPNILALVPLNAANFESGSATSGQVLTADGNGGAAFAAAAGGAAFTWDGVTLTVGEYAGYYPVTPTLTNAATPISGLAYFVCALLRDGAHSALAYLDVGSATVTLGDACYLIECNAASPPELPVYYDPCQNNNAIITLRVYLPTGGIVDSAGLNFVCEG